jgi:uncharacterized membrane protein YgcG
MQMVVMKRSTAEIIKEVGKDIAIMGVTAIMDSGSKDSTSRTSGGGGSEGGGGSFGGGGASGGF